MIAGVADTHAALQHQNRPKWCRFIPALTVIRRQHDAAMCRAAWRGPGMGRKPGADDWYRPDTTCLQQFLPPSFPSLNAADFESAPTVLPADGLESRKGERLRFSLSTFLPVLPGEAPEPVASGFARSHSVAYGVPPGRGPVQSLTVSIWEGSSPRLQATASS